MLVSPRRRRSGALRQADAEDDPGIGPSQFRLEASTDSCLTDDGEHLDDIFALRRFSGSDDFAQFHKAATGLQYWGARILGRDNRDAAE